jgi:hypothetical protein
MWKCDTDNKTIKPVAVIADTICKARFPVRPTDFLWIAHQDIVFPEGQSAPTGISLYQAYFRTLIADRSGFGFRRSDFVEEVNKGRFEQPAVGFMQGLEYYAMHMSNRDEPLD